NLLIRKLSQIAALHVHLARVKVAQAEKRGIMMDAPSQAAGDRLQKVAEVEVRNYRIIDLKQQLRSVPLTGHLLLCKACLLVVLGIVYGNCDLRSNLG